jgi:OmpA family
MKIVIRILASLGLVVAPVVGFSLSASAAPNLNGNWNIALAIGNSPDGSQTAAFLATQTTTNNCGSCSWGFTTSINGTADISNTTYQILGAPGQYFANLGGIAYLAQFDFAAGPSFFTGGEGELFIPGASGSLNATLHAACQLVGSAPTDVHVGLFSVAGGSGPSNTITGLLSNIPFPWSSCPTSTSWDSTGPSTFADIPLNFNYPVTAGSTYGIFINGLPGLNPLGVGSAPVNSKTLYYPSNVDHLTPAQIAVVNSVAAKAITDHATSITVTGYSDKYGAAPLKQLIATVRANVVLGYLRKYLKSHHASSIAVHVGKSQVLTSGSPASNRKVVITGY